MSTLTAPLRILVTGAAGQLGQSLAAQTTQHPALQIRFTDRQTLDISRPDAIESWLTAHPADVIINTAAYTAVDRAEEEPRAAMAINATAVGHLAKRCAAHGSRLIHLSTDYVFDGRKTTPYTEVDTPCPINAYGRSKLAGEELIARLAPDTVIVRTSWVFSPYGSNFLKTMLRLGRERKTLQIIDDQMGGPTYAPHIAQVLIALAQRTRQEVPGGVYHFAGQPHVSWHAFAQEIFAVALTQGLIPAAPTVLPLPSHAWPSAVQRPQNSCLDNRKLSAVLGPLSCDWRAGVRETLARLASWDEHLPLQ